MLDPTSPGLNPSSSAHAATLKGKINSLEVSYPYINLYKETIKAMGDELNIYKREVKTLSTEKKAIEDSLG